MSVKTQTPGSLKDRCVDAFLVLVVLVSMSGLVYSLLHQ